MSQPRIANECDAFVALARESRDGSTPTTIHLASPEAGYTTAVSQELQLPQRTRIHANEQ
jgi:hypothetical protein